MTLELIFNIIHVIFGFLSNNWLSALIAVLAFGYNLISKLRKRNSFTMIIDDMKHNLDSSNKVGLEYKIKFIVYVLICLSLSVLSVFGSACTVYLLFGLLICSDKDQSKTTWP